MKTHWLPAIVLTVASVSAASPALAQAKKESDLPDTIYKKDGKTQKADIQKLDAKGVIWNGPGAKPKSETTSWDDVTRIEYKDFPGELGGAEAALERRDYNKAEGAAEDAIKTCQEGRMKTLFLARAQVAKARALRGLGRFQDAAQVADAALTAADGGYYSKDAALEKVWALCEAGSADAPKAADDAQKVADLGFGDEFRYDICVLIGGYYYKAKDAANAIKNFSACKSSTRRDLQDRGKLGLGFVKLLPGQDDPLGAAEAFKSVLSTSTDAAALAGASVGLGDATLAQISTAPDKPAHLRQVLNIYLRGVVLAYPSGNSPTENHEAAIRKAADVCEKIAATSSEIKDKEKAAAAKKFYIDYQRKLYEELVKAYPNVNDAEAIHTKISKLKQDAQALTAQDKPAEK